jgi:two-component system, NarL family, response regulator LiaR
MSGISVLIVEDQIITRTGLRIVLEKVPDIDIVGEADCGLSAVSKAIELQPQVVLMDIGLPDIDGVEATRQIKQSLSTTRVVMLTAQEQEDHVFAALAAGADAYCLKNISTEQLSAAIRAVCEGAAWLDPGIASRVLRYMRSDTYTTVEQVKERFALSPREIDVLKLVVEGRSNHEIANILVVSPETIKTHVRHIMEKLAVSDRTQAAVKALRQGLI